MVGSSIGDAQVWVATRDQLSRSHDRFLDAAEWTRRARFRREDDQLRFATGTVLLKLAAARWIGTSPAEVAIDRTCEHCGQPHGRPVIRGSSLSVSIAHSGDRVLVALVDGCPLGVDVERITPARDFRRLAGDVLAGVEHAHDVAEFFVCWTRKEATVKATGDGLRMPLKEVVVSPPSAPPGLVSYGGRTLPATMTDVPVGPGYAAALTMLTHRSVSVSVRDAARLLHPGLDPPIPGIANGTGGV